MSAETPVAAPHIGQTAPDFELRDQYGRQVSLRGLLDETAVLVVFYPFAFSGICHGELSQIRDSYERFRSEHVQTVAVSCDPMFALRAWAEQEQFPFPLLSDFWPHGQVASSYGVFEPTMGAAVRGTFLIDPDGVVQWAQVTPADQQRDFGAFHQALNVLIGG